MLPIAACDAGSPDEQPLDAPPVHVIDVLGATSVAGDKLAYERLAPDGSTQILTTSAIKIRFDRLLHPTSASRQAICLQPVLHEVKTPADCTAGLFLEPAYDPVRREATYRLSLEQTFVPDTVYELTAYAPLDTTSGGFRSFEGTPLGAVSRHAFSVRHDGDEPPPRDLIPTDDHYCKGADAECVPRCAKACKETYEADDGTLGDCLDGCATACPRPVAEILGPGGCALKACHGADASAGLDMRTAKTLAYTAVSRVAHETQTGEEARNPDVNPSRFGRAMPIIDRGAPGHSYLVYKLLANPQTPLEVPFPADGAEVRRVQSTIITGAPMPPSTAFTATLRAHEMEWIAEWIFQGAPLYEKCP